MAVAFRKIMYVGCVLKCLEHMMNPVAQHFLKRVKSLELHFSFLFWYTKPFLILIHYTSFDLFSSHWLAPDLFTVKCCLYESWVTHISAAAAPHIHCYIRYLFMAPDRLFLVFTEWPTPRYVLFSGCCMRCRVCRWTTNKSATSHESKRKPSRLQVNAHGV